MDSFLQEEEILKKRKLKYPKIWQFKNITELFSKYTKDQVRWDYDVLFDILNMVIEYSPKIIYNPAEDIIVFMEIKEKKYPITYYQAYIKSIFEELESDYKFMYELVKRTGVKWMRTDFKGDLKKDIMKYMKSFNEKLVLNYLETRIEKTSNFMFPVIPDIIFIMH